MSAEKERDEAKEEAQVARLATVAVGDATAKTEGDLARVHDALAAAKEARAVAKEARHKAEAETNRLEVKRASLLLETTRYPLFTPKPAKTRRAWRRITKRP